MLKFVILLLFSVNIEVRTQTVPLLMWGSPSADQSVFSTDGTKDDIEFIDLVAPLMKTHLIVAFTDPHLRVRDFTLVKPGTNELAFANLQRVEPTRFFWSVETPSNILQYTYRHQHLPVRKTFADMVIEDSNFIPCEVNSLILIELPFKSSRREEQLSLNDEAVHTITNNIMHCRTIFAYMGKKTELQYSIETNEGTFLSDPKFTMFFESITYVNENYEEYYLNVSQMSVEEKKTDGPLFITLTVGPPPLPGGSSPTTTTTTEAPGAAQPRRRRQKGNARLITNIIEDIKGPLSFILSFQQGYAVINSFDFKERKHIVRFVDVPLDYSFACNFVNAYSANKTSLIFQNLQFQYNPRIEHTELRYNPLVFRESWYCEVLITEGILMGLVVVFCLIVPTLFIGIMALMDIKAGDRFDDPNGKTITVRAEE